MNSEIQKIRPDFESVEDLLIRFQTYTIALDGLNKYWARIKNDSSSDFEQIYSFQGEQRRNLEWFYNEGRQLTNDLRHNIGLWMITEKCPTFKSFIDHLENNWTKFLPECKQEYIMMKGKAEKIQNAPSAIVPIGITTYQEVLNIFDGIVTCVNIAKKSKLYRTEAGEYMKEEKTNRGNFTINAPGANIGNITGEATNSHISAEQKENKNIVSKKKGEKGILSVIWDYIKEKLFR